MFPDHVELLHSVTGFKNKIEEKNHNLQSF